MIQHAASTELKQKAEAGLAGGYMSNMKVLSSYKGGKCLMTEFLSIRKTVWCPKSETGQIQVQISECK